MTMVSIYLVFREFLMGRIRIGPTLYRLVQPEEQSRLISAVLSGLLPAQSHSQSWKFGRIVLLFVVQIE